MTASIPTILSDLIAFDSRSHLSNAGIAGYCAAFLEQRGWSVRRLPYADGTGVAKVNLVAVTPLPRAVEARPELALSGHLDVMPWEPAWTDATRLEARDGFLIGRGREAHSAYPELGRSAITSAAQAVLAIGSAAAKLSAETAAAFTPPFTTVNIGLIDGGTAKNIVCRPGDMAVAHRTGERVAVTDLEKCADMLSSAIRRFCA